MSRGLSWILTELSQPFQRPGVDSIAPKARLGRVHEHYSEKSKKEQPYAS